MSTIRTSQAEFIRVWQSERSLQQIAERLGISQRQVIIRAGTLLSHGVSLDPLTIQERQRRIEEARKEQSDEQE